VHTRYGAAVIRAVLTTCRPTQWTKNVLVAAAPLAAGTLLHPHVLLRTLLTFLVMTMAAAATYCLNDVIDASADAAHPTKSARPVASGELSKRVALGVAGALALLSLVLASPWNLRWVVLVYLVLTAAYSLGLKRQAVVELGVVASGFLLRAVAGGPATGTPLSQWFLIVAAFGSLFIVAGKRLSELVALDGADPISRPLLAVYTASYLRMVVAVSASVSIAAYCLWAFEVGARHHPTVPWAAISVAPLVIAILRYTLDVDHGRAQEPEQIVLRDRVLQGLGLLWLATFALTVIT
jgi:decaprenyl-phosphate phosphoribosyltransferase